jgi:hypothetical protein
MWKTIQRNVDMCLKLSKERPVPKKLSKNQTGVCKFGAALKKRKA